MTKQVETVGMRVLNADEFGLVSGGEAPTSSQVAGDIAAGVAMLALGGVVAVAAFAWYVARYEGASAVYHAMKKK